MNENETVGEFLEPTDITTLTDFAFYMLGRDRRTFRQGCWVRRDLDADIFADRWFTFDRWQEWQADVAKVCDS